MQHRPTNPKPPSTRSSRRPIGCAILLLATVPAAVLAFYTVSLWAGAASDCAAFWAGDRFRVTFFTLPALAAGLWVAFAIVYLVGARIDKPSSRTISVIAASIIMVLICWLWLGGTDDLIRSQSQSATACPSGLPEWWPSWLPR